MRKRKIDIMLETEEPYDDYGIWEWLKRITTEHTHRPGVLSGEFTEQKTKVITVHSVVSVVNMVFNPQNKPLPGIYTRLAESIIIPWTNAGGMQS
jgi:hypothetical protein